MKTIAGSVKCALLSLGLGLAGLGSAQAADGWYVGGSGGLSNYDISSNDFVPSPGVTGSTSIDDEDTFWKMFGGYRINENVAFEVAYADFGSFDAVTTVTSPITARNRGEFETTALLLDAVGILPLGDKHEIFGKVGLAVWEIDVDISGTPGGARLSPGFDEDGSDLHYGAGVAAHLTDTVTLRAEWEAVDLDKDLYAWSIGIQFNF